MAKEKTKVKTIDVLILHGKNEQLVTYLVEVCRALDLSADSALNLDSLKKSQEDKVNHYIRSCRVPVVLVALDPDAKASNRARPNVYDELARCRTLNRSDAIVLREVRQEKLLEVPSNIVGRTVEIPFRRRALHAVVPQLLREFKSRGLIAAASAANSASHDEPILLRFLDSMDALWDSEFDVAWDQVVVGDYASERRVALAIDRFFQHYHDGFSQYIRNHLHNSALKNHCELFLAQAQTEAVNAWMAAVESSLHAAQARKEDQSLSFTSEQSALYDEARREHRLGEKRHAKSPRSDQIAHLRRARSLAEQFLHVDAKRISSQ